MDGKSLIQELESLSPKYLDNPVVKNSFLSHVSVSGVGTCGPIWSKYIVVRTGGKSLTGRELLTKLKSFDSGVLERTVRISTGHDDLDYIRATTSCITLYEDDFLGIGL